MVVPESIFVQITVRSKYAKRNNRGKRYQNCTYNYNLFYTFKCIYRYRRKNILPGPADQADFTVRSKTSHRACQTIGTRVIFSSHLI